jgi:hypothetical protein
MAVFLYDACVAVLIGVNKHISNVAAVACQLRAVYVSKHEVP